MASFKKTLMILPTFFAIAMMANAGDSNIACPYSQSEFLCTCVQVSGEPKNEYTNITCQVGNLVTLPKFNTSTGKKYSVGQYLTIQFLTPRGFYIDEDSFSDFKSIWNLRFESYNGATSITWNERALEGTKIKEFHTSNIYILNSVFDTLHTETSSLDTFDVDAAGTYDLEGDVFKDYQHLYYLTISNTSISTIDPAAFSGLEKVIKWITLTDANVNESIFPILQGLKELTNLYLRGNSFKSVDLSMLDGMNQLYALALDRSSKLESLVLSDLDKVPQSLERVSVQQSAFKTIDPNFIGLLDRSNFELLDLSGSTGIICDENVRFLAKYTLCDAVKVDPTNAQCSNVRQSLFEYLQSSVHDPCK